MPSFDDYARYSPLPLVNLEAIAPPVSGVSMDAPSACGKHFAKGEACREHYRRIAEVSQNNELVPCPYGFASYPFELKAARLVFTYLVPSPRMLHGKAIETAKKHKANKVHRDKIDVAEAALRTLEERIAALEGDFTTRLAMALHEIRKLNRTVKQTAERLCIAENRSAPHNANPQLVQIWKTADMMSSQFDIIELLANDSSTKLPLGQQIDIYRLFDKCVRIYTTSQIPKPIILSAPQGFHAMIQACDKTIPIIPTVLIENAIKYSLPDRAITISLWIHNKNCHVEVANYAKLSRPLNDLVFKKGVRMTTEKEGSGNGLYLARKIAKQHKASLDVATTTSEQGISKCVFTFVVPAL